MRRFASLTTVCVLLAFTLTALAAQNPPAPREQGPGAAPAAPREQGPATPPAQQNAPQAAEKSFTGTLSKVDLTAKEITVKGADNKDMVFSFNDQTQMSGVDNSPQGLSGKTGSNLKITYREARGQNMASKIEVESKK
jgi:hypothetical protein